MQDGGLFSLFSKLGRAHAPILDEIVLDASTREINWLVSEEETARRKAAWDESKPARDAGKSLRLLF